MPFCAPFIQDILGQPWRHLIRTAKMLAVAHLVWEYGFSIGPAVGPSMLPTFEVMNELVLVSKLHRNGRGVKVGDLVVYKIPIFPDSDGIKRVIGMPGDYVMIDTPGSESESMIQVCFFCSRALCCYVLGKLCHYSHLPTGPSWSLLGRGR